MNPSLLGSKKFKATLLCSAVSAFVFISSHIFLGLDNQACIYLTGLICAPFLTYIGAEGFSEKDAKAVIEEARMRNQILDGFKREEGD